MLASPPIGLWPLAWLAFLPTLWLIAGAPRASRAGLVAWTTGVTITLGGFHWFVFPFVDHTGTPWPAAIALLLGLAAYQALSLMLAGRAIWWIRAWSARRRGRPLPMALVAPLAFVGLEHALPVIFPYTIAISQTSVLPVIQIADLFGAPAIAALLLAVAGAAWDVVERGRAAWRAPAAVGALLVATLGYGAWRLHDVDATRAAAPRLRVGLVQPNERMDLEAHDRDADLALLEDMQRQTAALEAAGAQVVVWSEASFPADLPRRLAHDLPDSSPWRIRRGFTVPVVIGSLSEERVDGTRRRYNSAYLLVDDDVRGRHDKIDRVLGSEWNPVVEWFPSLSKWMPPGFSRGDAPQTLPLDVDGRTVRLGPMICMEDVVPRFARDLAPGHPSVLVNMTNDSWFGTFAEPWQHRALAVFTAIELRADLVRAVNTGPTGWIDATGRLRAQGPVRAGGGVAAEGLLVEVAIMDGGHTLYAHIGNAFAWLCLALTLIGWIVARRIRRELGVAESSAAAAAEPAERTAPRPGAPSKPRSATRKRGKRRR
ncbi:MAG: apolipoprotein N-acyltransferase [Kofleriaceae bacterium]|nr:apolipoprotein N-acyltransferase [Kofleriaceae bacterium]